MTAPTVDHAPAATDPWRAAAANLRRIADALDAHAGQPGRIAYQDINIQIGHDLPRDQRCAAVDAIAAAAGMPAADFEEMGDGGRTWHYAAREENSPFRLAVYAGHANAA